MSKELKQKIKEVAVVHFDRDGYHGTTIRNIAREVECSLPMVYYYYENKSALFYEIIAKDYFEILKKQSSVINEEDLIEYYTAFVFNLNNLSEYDKKVYRLGIKVYLAFDGDEKLLKIMEDWEKSIIPRHYELILNKAKSKDDINIVVRTLTHVLENLIESIVVKNKYIEKEDIREEINHILKNIV